MNYIIVKGISFVVCVIATTYVFLSTHFSVHAFVSESTLRVKISGFGGNAWNV